MWTPGTGITATTAQSRRSTGCSSPPAAAFLPPISGLDKQNVFTFRNLDDTARDSLRRQARRKGVVIGGGLLGLEAARGLQVQGCDVTVIHLLDTLMNMQLDPTGGLYLKAAWSNLAFASCWPRHAEAARQQARRGSRILRAANTGRPTWYHRAGIPPTSIWDQAGLK